MKLLDKTKTQLFNPYTNILRIAEIVDLLNHKDYAIGELAREMGVAQNNLRPYLERLTKEKIITIKPAGYGKIKVVSLVNEDIVKVPEIKAANDLKFITDAVKNMSAETRKELIKVINKMNK